MTSAWMRGAEPSKAAEQLLGGKGSVVLENTRTSLGYMSETLATKTRWPSKGKMMPRGRGAPTPNREALSVTKSTAPTLRTRPVAKRALDEEDGPVRIITPVDASACPTVGANCRRYGTADAMGMAKEGDKPRLLSMVPEARSGTL